jgi:hypothetical protein
MEPLCIAARSALLIDPDKSVRPCCQYGRFGMHIPRSMGIARLDGKTTIQEIEASAAWQHVVSELDANRVPEGCTDCIKRERETGRSLRKNLYHKDWAKGLTYLEIDSSNLCSLQCRHCNSEFSHRWANHHGEPVFKPAGDDLLALLKAKDLGHLDRVMFKGGEPMMNSDVLVTLQYLRDIGRLSQVNVNMVTNGTVANREVMELMAQAKCACFIMSVDGVGATQTYIRAGKSEVENIEAVIKIAIEVIGKSGRTYLQFSALPSIMAYNVATLPDIATWWETKIAPLHKNVLPMSFHHFVIDPPELSVRVLRDHTRSQIAARLEALDAKLYTNVVNMLRQPYLGDELHDKFVAVTKQNDLVLNQSVHQALPHLGHEVMTAAEFAAAGSPGA